MKKYYLSDRPGSYWCSQKGTFTSEDGHKKSRIGFWSEFESSKQDRIVYNKLTGNIQILICRIFGTNLNPKLFALVSNSEEVKK